MADLKINQIPKGKRVEPVELFGSKKRVSKSGEEFKKAMEGVAKNLKGNFKLFTKQTALRIYAGIIRNNPVDTGYSRASWFFGATPNKSILPPIDNAGKNAYSAPNIGGVSSGIGLSYTYYLNNNLPYVLVLEGGSSDQAPTGFIANTIFSVTKELQQIR